MLARLGALVRPGGRVVMSDGWWRRTPSARDLEFLGGSADEYTGIEETVALGESLGWTVHWSRAASHAGWVTYEDAYHAGVITHAESGFAGEQAAELRSRIEAWRSMSLAEDWRRSAT